MSPAVRVLGDGLARRVGATAAAAAGELGVEGARRLPRGAALRCGGLLRRRAGGAPAGGGGPYGIGGGRRLRGAEGAAGGFLDDRRLARRTVGEVVERVAVDLVRGDVPELHGAAREQRVDAHDQFLIGDRLARGRLPPLALPAGQPGGDGLHRVLGVHPDLHRDGRVGGCQQAFQRREFRDVVRRGAQRPGLPPDDGFRIVGDDPGPARGPGVSFRGAVTGGDHAFSHGRDHARQRRVARSRLRGLTARGRPAPGGPACASAGAPTPPRTAMPRPGCRPGPRSRARSAPRPGSAPLTGGRSVPGTRSCGRRATSVRPWWPSTVAPIRKRGWASSSRSTATASTASRRPGTRPPSGSRSPTKGSRCRATSSARRAVPERCRR